MYKILFLFYLAGSTFIFSQESFLVVNHDSISYTEFEKVYAYNITAEGKQKAVETYIDFTLLRQQAHKTQIDTTKAFRSFLQINIASLKDPYLYDTVVTKRLTNEIWQRLQTDRQTEVYAIGIANPYNAQLRREREQLISQLHTSVCSKQALTPRVEEYLQKHPVKSLWIRPFVISSEIEKVAYQVTKGNCSEIKASENGNFFVKVIDERPSAGIVTAEYIYNNDKSLIDEALDLLNKGTKWTDVKSKYGISEGLKSFFNKPRFEADLPEVFYNAIQKMEQNSFSEPLHANDGWYILNIIEQQKFIQKENWVEWIEERIRQSDYAMNYVQATEKKALNTVKAAENKTALAEILDLVGNNFFAQNNDIQIEENQDIWSTKNQSFTQNDLINELNIAKKYFDENTDVEDFKSEVIPKFKNQFLIREYVQFLEQYDEQYAKDIEILKAALLLNYYVDNQIYDVALNDSVGMKQYLKNNILKFSWPKRYQIEVYRFRKEEQGEEIRKMLKKRHSFEEIRRHFNGKKDNEGSLSVIAVKGNFFPGDGFLPETFKPNKKIQEISMFNNDAIIRINQTLDPISMTLEEGGTVLQEEYKSSYYQRTLRDLRQHAIIHIPAAFK